MGGRAGEVSLLIDPDELKAELAAIEAESIGWLPLGEITYLHVGAPEAPVIDVVGVPDAGMVGMNVGNNRGQTTVSDML